jgi:hypothetical protein
MSRCTYCGCTLYGTRRSAKHAGNENMLWTKDHVVARAHGGTETVPCCLRCNNAKEDGDAVEFARFAALMLKGKKPRVDTRDAMLMFRAWTMRSLF